MDRTKLPCKPSSPALRGLIPVLFVLVLAACSGPGAESEGHGIGMYFNMQDVLEARQALGDSGLSIIREQSEFDGWEFRASVTGPGINTAITSDEIFTFEEADVLGYDTYLTVPGVPDGSGRVLDVKVLELITGEEPFQFIQGIATGINVSGGSATINFPFSSSFCFPSTDIIEGGTGSDTIVYDFERTSGVTIFVGSAGSTGSITLIYEDVAIVDTADTGLTAGGSWISYLGDSTEMTVQVNDPASESWLYEFVCLL